MASRQRINSRADGRTLPHEVPYLHVRAPRRVVGVGGEGDPLAKITANMAGLLAPGEQVDHALAADEDLSSSAPYR
jgi:hypothetical protein